VRPHWQTAGSPRLVGSETGPLIYFGVRWNMGQEVTAFAVQVATSMGLVCFDVSRGRLLS
jgi:hypothetical protein